MMPEQCQQRNNCVQIPVLLLVVVLSFLASEVSALEANGTFWITPQFEETRKNSAFSLPETSFPHSSQTTETRKELQLQQQGLHAAATFVGKQFRDSPQETEVTGYMYEAYFDSSLGSVDITLGKKVTSLGVAFGFRPLDVIQQKQKNTLYSYRQEGVPLVSAQYYWGLNALSFIYAKPAFTYDQADYSKNAESLVIQGYFLIGDTDLHLVGRASEAHRWQLGTGFTHVFGESTSFYGSILHSKRYLRTINRLTKSTQVLSLSNPLYDEEHRDGVQFVTGASWTGSSGVSLLLEYWHDDFAYTEAEWKKILFLNAQQRELVGLAPDQAIFGNIAYNRNYFAVSNLHQNNLLIRVAQTGTKIQPAISWLTTPADNGFVTTASGIYELNQQSIEFGLRHFDGPQGSVYRELHIEEQFFLSWGLSWKT